MKKILVPGIVVLLFSCSSSPTKKWDAAYASKTCFDAAAKGKYDLTDKQIKRLKGICDCVGEKMVTQFKSEKEANEKMLDAAANANDCRQLWDKNPLNQ